MKILLVEDHVCTREQIKLLIDQEQDLTVIADVGSAEEGIAAVRRLHPDVVVMDMMLPGMNGLDAISIILSERPETGIIALSNHSSPALVQVALDIGARAFIRKNRALEELVPAIRVAGLDPHVPR